MTTEQWLSIVDYARMFNLSDMTVRRRIKSGKLPAKLIDQKYYISIPLNSSAPSQAFANSKNSDISGVYDAMPSRGGQENKVVKGYPGTYNYASHLASNSNSTNSKTQRRDYLDDEQSVIPHSLSEPLREVDKTLIDTRALLAFCEASMRKMAEVERRQVEKFKIKLELLEVNLKSRDAEIQLLKQQLEDLQLLVKILDDKGR